MTKDNKAHFYIDDGFIRCEISSGNKKMYFTRNEAKDFLKQIDNEDWSIRFKHNKVVLTNDIDQISIDISHDIFTGQYKYLVRKTYKKLKKLQREYMRDKYNGVLVKKALIRGSLVGAGPLAAILMATVINKTPSSAKDDLAKPIPFESIIEENDRYISKIAEEIPNKDYLTEYIESTIPQEEIEIESTYEPVQIPHVDYGLETHYSNIDLDIEDLSQEDDVIALREKYWDVAKRAEARWGIDARVLIAMLTQESRGKDTNLMQIEFNAINDEIMTVYNFEEERYMRVVFTNSPELYAGKVDMTISEADLKNEFTQLACAGLIMNYHNLNDFNAFLNPAAMIDEYNKGQTYFIQILDATPGSRMEILQNTEDTSFLAYDYVCGTGDPEYVNHTMRYVDLSDGPLVMKTFNKDENGNKYPVVIEFNINKTLSNNNSYSL